MNFIQENWQQLFGNSIWGFFFIFSPFLLFIPLVKFRVILNIHRKEKAAWFHNALFGHFRNWFVALSSKPPFLVLRNTFSTHLLCSHKFSTWENAKQNEFNYEMSAIKINFGRKLKRHRITSFSNRITEKQNITVDWDTQAMSNGYPIPIDLCS